MAIEERVKYNQAIISANHVTATTRKFGEMFESTLSSLSRTARFAEMMGKVLRYRLDWKHPFYMCHLVTGKCNCRCDSCYWRRSRKDELTTEEIRRLYRDARDNGFVANLIWGGEPLMREDFPEIVRFSQKMNFVTTVITNAYLLPERMDDVAPHTDSFIISLDHPGEKHDEIRKRPGLFDRVVESVGMLKRDYPQVKTMINCLLTNYNKDAMPEMARFCDRLGVSLYVCPMGYWDGETGLKGGDEKPAAKATQKEEASAWRQLLRMKRRGYRINNSFRYLKFMQKYPRSYRCHFPKIILQVEPWGGVIDCMDWNTYANVRDMPFRDILKHGRTQELGGPEGEKCSVCNNPNRIDMSWFWELKPEPLAAVFKLYFEN